MTPEMVFECLVVSDDRQVVSLMDRDLERLSIDIEHCANPTEGLGLLARRDIDLVVCDSRGAPDEMKLLNGVLNTDRKRKPTVLTIVDGPFLTISAKHAGAHVIIQKPLTQESSARGLKTAYSRMVREERRNARHAIMRFVVAKNECGELLPVTVTDICERGVGLLSKQKLNVGELLSFDLTLPNAATSINAQVQVLWVRHNLAGADFERMSEAERQFLYRWLASRVRRDRPPKL